MVTKNFGKPAHSWAVLSTMQLDGSQGSAGLANPDEQTDTTKRIISLLHSR